jgi:hypothetical protein
LCHIAHGQYMICRRELHDVVWGEEYTEGQTEAESARTYCTLDRLQPLLYVIRQLCLTIRPPRVTLMESCWRLDPASWPYTGGLAACCSMCIGKA